jgi:uncharacterized BrkB/YihY/UPF0761 family membrane protein
MKPFDSFGWCLSIFFPMFILSFLYCCLLWQQERKIMKAYQILIGSLLTYLQFSVIKWAKQLLGLNNFTKEVLDLKKNSLSY